MSAIHDEQDSMTLTRFILAAAKANEISAASVDLCILMTSIQHACIVIGSAVRKAGISGLYGMEGTINVQGEEVKKLDIISHNVFVNALRGSGVANVLVSEEQDEEIIIGDGKYSVVFDPLDGSSNIDCNISVGSIFGVYAKTDGTEASVKDVLLPGKKLVAAGYCMYGSSTQMVLSWGAGVHVFTLDPTIGEFILTAKDIKIPAKSKTIYAVNE